MGYNAPIASSSASSTSSHNCGLRQSRSRQHARSPNAAARDATYLSPIDQQYKWSMPYTPHTPVTGPTGNDRRALYSYVPLPPQTDRATRLEINPLLQYIRGQAPKLIFDVSSAPIEPFPGCFAQAATHPPLPSLAISIPNVPWVLVVHHSLLPYVTIGDVFNMISMGLQMPMEDLSRWGPRRIDLLRGRHRFLGISTSRVGDETFDLHTS